MARIPLYQQNQLASSLVGTPGVDTSAVSAFNNASNALESVGRTVYNSLEEDYRLNQRELLYQQRQMRQAAKEQKNLLDQNIVETANAELSVAINEKDGQLRNDFRNNVTGANGAWSAQMNDLVSAKLETLTDPKQRLMAQTRFTQTVASQNRQFMDYVNARVPEIAKDNTVKIGDALRLSTNSSSLSGTQVLTQLEQWSNDPNVRQSFETAWGGQADPQMRKYKSDAARNFLSLVANEGDLNRLDTLIKDKRFDSIIEGTDKEPFYARQRQIATQQRQLANHQTILDGRAADNSAISTLGSASPTGRLEDAPPQLIQQALSDPKLSPSMRARLTAAKPRAQRALTTDETDSAIVKKYGAYHGYAQRLHDGVIAEYNKLKGLHGSARDTQLVRLNQALDRYDNVNEDLEVLSKSLKTAKARQLVQQYNVHRRDDYGTMRGALAGDKNVQAMNLVRGNFVDKMGDAGVVYSSPQQQATYNFYYNSRQREIFAETLKNRTINRLLRDPVQMKALRNQIKSYAVQQTEGLFNGR